MRTCACTADCAPSAARRPPGTCRSPSCAGRSPPTRPARSRRASRRLPEGRNTMSKATLARINDFTIKIATVNGTGSGSSNTLLMKSIFRSGIPVSGKNFFPSNIQGLPTWYEIRVNGDGYVGRSGAVDVMVAMNSATYARDLAEVSPGGVLIYDSTWPRDLELARRDIEILGVPLARMCNEHFKSARTRILMKNMAYVGSLAALLASNLEEIELGHRYAVENFECPLPMRVEPLDKTKGHIMIDGNTAAALGCVYA